MTPLLARLGLLVQEKPDKAAKDPRTLFPVFLEFIVTKTFITVGYVLNLKLSVCSHATTNNHSNRGWHLLLLHRIGSLLTPACAHF